MMSNDARYLLHYEFQNYANKFPSTEIDKLNNYSGITWLSKLKQVDGYHLDFIGETKHTYPDEIRKISKADQVLECKDGDNWRDITNEQSAKA